jgi:hypothetical protein
LKIYGIDSGGFSVGAENWCQQESCWRRFVNFLRFIFAPKSVGPEGPGFEQRVGCGDRSIGART